MCHLVTPSAKFLRALIEADQQLAQQTAENGCQHCGGRLHKANYPRKPRGELAEQESEFSTRWSFCCADCRRRTTPPSLRFLGRRVYIGQQVIMVSHAAVELCRQFGKKLGIVPRRTVLRWLHWWQELLPKSVFWQTLRGLFAQQPRLDALPCSLLSQLGEGELSVTRLLRLLQPLTTSSASSVRDG